MGEVRKKIFENNNLSNFMFNNRLAIELCENVHLHYRDMRLEFSSEEFLLLLRVFASLNRGEIRNFNYSNTAFKSLFTENILPDKTEFNNRLVVEEQDQGHYHIHYRNMRIEFDV